MELKQLIEDLEQALFEDMCEGCNDDTSFSATVPTEDGEIEVYICESDGWDPEVTVYHAGDNLRENPNLEKFLEERVEVDWDAVEEYWRDNDLDEWEAHGFRDEADFWRWKEGR